MTDSTIPLLEARAVHRSFSLPGRTIPVLRGVDLAVHRGERVAIMGASGAGKSTLLHIMGGLDQPTQGHVYFEGTDLYALSDQDRTVHRGRSIGFVFQSYHLLPELDVVENVLLPAMRRLDWLGNARVLRQRAFSLLEQVGLADRADHRPMELSGGEQQRVALARALMNEPDIVLADEPTGNLDSVTGEQVLHQLFSLVDDHGHTLLLVTHNEALAARCDRSVLIQDGRILESS